MKCELCDYEMDGKRRSRDAETNKMLCWNCVFELRRIRKGQILEHVACSSREFHKLNQLRDEVWTLKNAQYPVAHEAKKHPYNNAVSAMPPLEILQKSLIALDEFHIFSDFAQVLGDYYGIVAPQYLDNPKKCGEKALATYYWSENIVYAAKGPMKYRTAFHEMWHALERHGIVPHTKDSEKNAEIFARHCLRRLGRDENS